MQTFDGDTNDDRRLWHTYIFLARHHAIRSGGQPAGIQPAIADDPANRVKESFAEALQTILFSSFALEYRLKRVLLAMGVSLNRNETLKPLFDRFWNSLKNIDRCDGKGKCAPPAEWAACEPKLKKLIPLRNKMAHANYQEVLKFFGGVDSLTLAREYYNAVVDAVMLINVGTGNDALPLNEIEEYFRPLRVVEK